LLALCPPAALKPQVFNVGAQVEASRGLCASGRRSNSNSTSHRRSQLLRDRRHAQFETALINWP